MSGLSESTVESAALSWLANTGWPTAYGPDIAPDTLGAERADYGEAILPQRLCNALARVIDFDDPANNDWLAVNQFTVVENRHERRPDVVPVRQRPAAGGHRTEEPD